MTDTQVPGALVFPEDEGMGVADKNEDYNSAGYLALLASKVQGEYVDSGLTFDVDQNANEVTISPGHAFVEFAFDSDGNPTNGGEYGPPVQQGSDFEGGYSEQLPNPVTAVYVLQQEATLSLAEGVNDVYLFSPPSGNDEIYARHGTDVAEPNSQDDGYPLHLGTVDTNSGDTTRPNDRKPITGDTLNGALTGNQEVRNLLGTGLEIQEGELAAVPPFDTESVYADDKGTVANGDYEIITVATVPGQKSFAVKTAELLTANGEPRPQGLSLRLINTDENRNFVDGQVILENATGDAEDGFNEFNGEKSYSNMTEDPRKVALVVDNGQFGSGTGSAKDYVASAAGIIQEASNRDIMIDISPNGDSYVGHNGATFNAQSESNVGFYAINNQSDTIEFDLSQATTLQNPVMVVNTVFGPTGFTLEDRSDDSTIVSEASGYDSDVWIIDLSGTSGQYRLTGFTDTQAAFYADVRLYNEQ